MPGTSLRHYRFDWKLTLLLLVLLPVLLRLGFWQLAREAEKLELQQVYSERRQEAPVGLEALAGETSLQYRNVRLQGRFDNEHVFLLDNRIYEGRPGFDVLQPFLSAAGPVVLVNRGWQAMGPTRTELPAPPPVEGMVTISASVYVPVGEQITLGDTTPGAGWPKVIQETEPAELLTLAGYDRDGVFAYSVRLASGSAGVLTRNWPLISTEPEKHRAYAVQWFAMALALVLLYGYYSCRPRDDNKE